MSRNIRLLACSLALFAPGCLMPESEGIAPTAQSSTMVRLDFFHRPLPDLPLPNDIATRFDAKSLGSQAGETAPPEGVESLSVPTALGRMQSQRQSSRKLFRGSSAVVVPSKR